MISAQMVFSILYYSTEIVSLIKQRSKKRKKTMKYFALLLCAIGCTQAIPTKVYEHAELCQPWVCRAPACKCTSTDSGGNFPVEKTPQV